MHPVSDNQLGCYLRDRRTRLDPAALGFDNNRRRTPGLRREEVAQRAAISPTWYTWLEQGRGGAPSADVLNRISRALMLTDGEREHLFLLGLGRTPEVRYHKQDSITPRLQRLLDTLKFSPALIKTATWDVVAWNRAATLVLTDYSTLPPGSRNILRMMFANPQAKDMQRDWRSVARFVVNSFRADAVRAGAAREIDDLVSELCQTSPEFAALWRENDVEVNAGDGIKHLRHPVLGEITLEYSSFLVDGRPDLSMVVYNPATERDEALIRAQINNRPEAAANTG